MIEIFERLELIISNYLGFVITFLLSFIGYFLSFYFYRKSNPKKQLYFYFQGQISYSSKNENDLQINILYKGEKVEELGISTFAIINTGKLVILKDDISPIDPLRIVIQNNFEIMDAKITEQSRPACNCKIIKIDKKFIELSFDFLEYGDFIMIEIITNYNHSKHLSYYDYDRAYEIFSITGTIIGINKIPIVVSSSNWYHDILLFSSIIGVVITIFWGTQFNFIIYVVNKYFLFIPNEIMNFIFILIYFSIFLSCYLKLPKTKFIDISGFLDEFLKLNRIN